MNKRLKRFFAMPDLKILAVWAIISAFGILAYLHAHSWHLTKHQKIDITLIVAVFLGIPLLDIWLESKNEE